MLDPRQNNSGVTEEVIKKKVDSSAKMGPSTLYLLCMKSGKAFAASTYKETEIVKRAREEC
jgi:hypothetical protein